MPHISKAVPGSSESHTCKQGAANVAAVALEAFNIMIVQGKGTFLLFFDRVLKSLHAHAGF